MRHESTFVSPGNLLMWIVSSVFASGNTDSSDFRNCRASASLSAGVAPAFPGRCRAIRRTQCPPTIINTMENSPISVSAKSAITTAARRGGSSFSSTGSTPWTAAIRWQKILIHVIHKQVAETRGQETEYGEQGEMFPHSLFNFSY